MAETKKSMNTEIQSLLSSVEPFSLLPEKAGAELCRGIEREERPAGSLLRVQGQTPAREIYLVESGRVEWYFEENGLKLLHRFLEQGEIFGALSVLLEENEELFSVRAVEDTVLLRLDRERFLELMQEYPSFLQACTHSLGKWFLDPTFAAIVNRGYHFRTGVPPLFLKQAARSLATRDLPTCGMDDTVVHAAKLMSGQGRRAVLVQNQRGETVGVLTDEDLRARVVAAGYDPKRRVRHVMSTPSVKAEVGMPLMQAIPKAARTRAGYLPVVEGAKGPVGVLEKLGLRLAENYRPVYLLRTLREARTPDEMVEAHAELPRLVRSLIYGGLGTARLVRTISLFSDALIERALRFAQEELGPPPAPFAFLAFGSKGRSEHTLYTHQDHAIVFADPEQGPAEPWRLYFLALAREVCTMLKQAGFEYCPSNIMASNPDWCQPLSGWKAQYREWVGTPNPNRLLRAIIFFDFRAVCGEPSLAGELRRHVFDCAASYRSFFRQIADIAMNFKPPAGTFKDLDLELTADHRRTSEIRQVLTPIVHYARYCALRHRIEETGTLARLQALELKKALPSQDRAEMAEAFNTLMRYRLLYQTMTLTRDEPEPENLVHLDRLTDIDEQLLRDLSREVERYQEKLDVIASRYSNPFSPHREVLRTIRRRGPF
jgi:CBS domain-containing protein